MTEYVNKDRVCQNLSNAIKIKTISHLDENETDWNEFEKFYSFLCESFPMVHKNLKVEHVGRAGLVFIWEGTEKNLEPIAFLSHQDVVPVTEGTEGDWKHPPFEGYNDGEFIWGRGAIDMKNHLVAVMESVETLLEEGYAPKRSVYLCFGYNEELMIDDGNSATMIAEHLKASGVHFDSIIDEGGAMIQVKVPGVIDAVLAGVGLGEKGYADFKVTVSAKGGHSSAPPNHTAIGILSKRIESLEKHQFPESVPDYFVELLSLVGEKVCFPLNQVFKVLPHVRKLLGKVLTLVPEGASFVRTCQAVTMCEGSPAANVLPQRASATINFRMMQGTTLKDVEKKIEKYMGGKNTTIELLKGHEASQVSSTNTRSFNTIREIAMDLDERIVVSPFMVMGGTDAYHYECVSDTIYRFSPFTAPVSVMSTAHSTNERVPVASLVEAVAFFKAYIRKMTT